MRASLKKSYRCSLVVGAYLACVRPWVKRQLLEQGVLKHMCMGVCVLLGTGTLTLYTAVRAKSVIT